MSGDSEIREAVVAWLRAEFLFRLGPHAYSKEAQTWLIHAENRLRLLVSGEPDLRSAFESLPILRKRLK